MPYQNDSRLPPTAVDTGLHQDATTLWVADDAQAVYAVMPGRVERWPALHAYTEDCY